MPLIIEPSYHKINYGLRPAKQIERKMLCEALQRLSEIYRIDEYRYVGMGSIFFTDFMLFHKLLGLSKMISIEEAEEKSQPRFEFNCPYRCIDLRFGRTTELLPLIGWDDRTILWLDYDKRLDKDKLEDIRIFCEQAKAGSILIITVNADPGTYDSNSKPNRLTKLKALLGEKRIPIDVEEKHLPNWGTAAVYRRIINGQIKEVLSNRNGILADSEQFEYRQLFHFNYSDGAKMMTTGGIIYRRADENRITKCSLNRLEFVRNKSDASEDAYLIDVPVLTSREMRYLDKMLPGTSASGFKLEGVPLHFIERYTHVYRYFPHFAEIEI